MILLEIDKSPTHPPLNKMYVQAFDGTQFTAIIGCPICGGSTSLEHHRIDVDGVVTPTVVCPRGCGFKGDLHLIGWTPRQNGVIYS